MADADEITKSVVRHESYCGDAKPSAAVNPIISMADNPAVHMDPAHRAAVEKQLKRKLDARCSLFVLIYIMNYLDRNNISAARLKGLQEDLHINDTQFATCLSIVYVAYILMQIPSNVMINRVSRPSVYIGVAVLLWGMTSTLSGNVHSFGGMVAVRFCLGFVEAAFLPGALMILSKWYTKRELTYRNALLFCGNLISNAFSSLLAAGILSNMDGVLGHAGWRWMFWIEGTITMFIAILAAFILPDMPHNSRGFTAEELQVAQLRMTEDVGEADIDSEEMGVFDGLVLAVRDWKIYVMLIFFIAYIIGLSFNAFFPSLTGTLGFATTPTLLMSAPPWVFACIVSLLVSLHADRTQERVSPPSLIDFHTFLTKPPLVLARHRPHLRRSCRLHHQHVNPQYGRPLRRALPADVLVCRLRRDLQLAGQLVPASARQTCRCHRHHQRLRPARQRGRLVRLEPARGRLPQELRHRHGYVRCHHCRLHRLPLDSGPREQGAPASGGAGFFGQPAPGDWRDCQQRLPLLAVVKAEQSVKRVSSWTDI